MIPSALCCIRDKGFQKELNNYIKENDLISIKGYIEIDDLHRIIIVATKLLFYQAKKLRINFSGLL